MAHDAAAVKVETFSVKFEPEWVARFWQHNAMRLMRANERVLHGLMAAATREMELAQELTRYNLEKLHEISNGAAAETSSKADGETNFSGFEHIVAGFREVSEGLWKTFGDASKLLMEGTLTQAKEAVVEPIRQAAKQADTVIDQAFEPFSE